MTFLFEKNWRRCGRFGRVTEILSPSLVSLYNGVKPIEEQLRPGDWVAAVG